MKNGLLSLHALEQLATAALQAAGAAPHQAEPTARALVAAEAQGLPSHGLARVAMYAGHLRAARVDGAAQPRILAETPAAVLVDAADGFAFPACALAVQEAIARARTSGIAIGAVTNSHHFGAAAWHLEPAGQARMVALAFGNSPAAMPCAGGRRAILGTNPIAAIFPRTDSAPVVIDLSLSEVARGKLMLAAQQGQPIPPGWALDQDGQPTTDARAGLQGCMLPFGAAQGGSKGALLALLVELLVVSLTGAHFGAEADSFFEEQGRRARIGQVFVVINPAALAGQAVYAARVEALMAAMLQDAGTRVPGAQRAARHLRARQEGLGVPAVLLQNLRALAGAPAS